TNLSVSRNTPFRRTLYPFFFIHAPPPTDIYTLSLHDALPISISSASLLRTGTAVSASRANTGDTSSERIAHPRPLRPFCRATYGDRKSTRLNSSHVAISYAVFCLKKKKNRKATQRIATELKYV